MLFKSAIMTQASGSLGGMTAARNRGGMYFRARAIPTDPNTPAQATIRAHMGALVQRWINTLTGTQRFGWNLYASNVPLTGPLGDPITVSGMNHYVRSNVPRLQLVTSIIDTAPGIFDTGTLSLPSVSNLSEAVQQLDVSFTDADGWNIADGHLLVQQSRPQNPTINYFRGPYQLGSTVNGMAVSPVTIPSVFPFVEGQRMFFRCRASYADGRLTQAIHVGPVVAIA